MIQRVKCYKHKEYKERNINEKTTTFRLPNQSSYQNVKKE